jgi:hypothetical protein
MMGQNAMRAVAERLLDAVKCRVRLDNVTIVETGEPVLKTKLRAAETAAAALAAQAALIGEIWRVDMLTPANEVIRTLRICAAPNTSGRQKAKLAC